MNFLRVILLPFVPVYAVIIRIRNLFFENNIFKSKKVNAKVISVGNLTTGGSGKTPMVIYLLNLLKNENINVGVLSRGYGRKSKGYLFVADENKIIESVAKAGDEIYHTVEECKVPAAVSEDRVIGAENLIKDSGVDTIVLDDAFQHRWIERDINLLIFEQRFLIENNFVEQSLLPTGNLREPFDSVRRADVIIINRKFSRVEELPDKIKKFFQGITIFNSHYKAIGFVDVIHNTEYPIEEFLGQKSLIVCGIANPYSFINALKQIKVNTDNQLFFSDHKHYRNKEVQKIRKEFYSTNSYSVITTQKDAVKLTEFSKELDDIDIFYLKINLVMDDEESFKNYILKKLNHLTS